MDERYFSELMITVRDLKKETRMLLNKTRLTSNADALAFSMDAFFQADDMVEKLNEENNSVTINELETAIENIRLDMKKVTDLIG